MALGAGSNRLANMLWWMQMEWVMRFR